MKKERKKKKKKKTKRNLSSVFADEQRKNCFAMFDRQMYLDVAFVHESVLPIFINSTRLIAHGFIYRSTLERGGEINYQSMLPVKTRADSGPVGALNLRCS